MQDNSLPTDNSSNPIHVDDYQPPQPAAPPSDNQPFNAPSAPVSPTDDNQNTADPLTALEEVVAQAKVDDNQPNDDQSPSVEEPAMDDSQVDDQPEEQPESTPVVDNSPIEANQSLETQNIFDLLGVSDGKADEKEAFLDELQEVIWEDFTENDVGLLLNEEQVVKLKEIQSKGKTPEVQEEMLVYLEKLLPDLEDMMMDKALELKEDMVLERISGMKEFYSANPEAMGKISQAEELISQNKWADAGNLLNEIK